MYLPPHFEQTAPAAIAALIEEAPLACLVAQGREGLVANHLPLLPAPGERLIGHIALANDLHRQLAEGQEVLAIFRGAQGYVSPNDYPSKAEHHRHVPTWNYEVVHVQGRISFQHDEHTKRAAVGLLTRLHERRANGAAAWRMADAPVDYMAMMLEAIVALRIDITGVLAKSKLSQNRAPADLDGAIAGLEARGDTALAERMRRVRDDGPATPPDTKPGE